MLRDFSDLQGIVEKKNKNIRTVVAAAHDLHTLKGIGEACLKGMIRPVLVGDSKKIRSMISENDIGFGSADIIDTKDDTETAVLAAEMIAKGNGHILVKGGMQTSDLLREIVKKEYGLLTGEIMSHVGLFQIPAYHKLQLMTDAGMVPCPDLEQKRQILVNAVNVMNGLGVSQPKVAVLCAAEQLNPKIPASLDAAELKKLNGKGEIENCIVEGPISIDLACSFESAEIKAYTSPVAGDADILLMPDMTAGNICAKALMLAGGAMMAGVIVGVKAPIVVVSRAASADEKYWSLVFAAAMA